MIFQRFSHKKNTTPVSIQQPVEVSSRSRWTSQHQGGELHPAGWLIHVDPGWIWLGRKAGWLTIFMMNSYHFVGK